MKMFNFLSKEKSSAQAKDRLKLVLIHDRAMISPATIDKLKNDLIDAISRYVEIDCDHLMIELMQSDENKRDAALIANIPLKVAKKD